MVRCEKNRNVTPSKEMGVVTRSLKPGNKTTSPTKKPYQRWPKPPYTYAGMVIVAIQQSPHGKLTLAQIIEAITDMFTFFRICSYSGWKDSVRHNLSQYECFQMLEDPHNPRKKKNCWVVNDNHVVPAFFKRTKINDKYKATLQEELGLASAIVDISPQKAEAEESLSTGIIDHPDERESTQQSEALSLPQDESQHTSVKATPTWLTKVITLTANLKPVETLEVPTTSPTSPTHPFQAILNNSPTKTTTTAPVFASTTYYQTSCSFVNPNSSILATNKTLQEMTTANAIPTDPGLASRHKIHSSELSRIHTWCTDGSDALSLLAEVALAAHVNRA